MGSILTEIKSMLGLQEDYTAYDPELIIYINSAIAELNQLGLGPDQNFSITDKTATWESFLGSDTRYNGAKTYMYLTVRLLFDPPANPPALAAFEKLRVEAGWRLNVQREDIENPPAAPLVVIEDIIFPSGGTVY